MLESTGIPAVDVMKSNAKIYCEDKLRKEILGDCFLIIANNFDNDSEERPYEIYISRKELFKPSWGDLLENGSDVPLRGYVGIDFDVANEISSDVNALIDKRFSDCKRIHSFDDLVAEVDRNLVDFRKRRG